MPTPEPHPWLWLISGAIIIVALLLIVLVAAASIAQQRRQERINRALMRRTYGGPDAAD